MNKFLPYIFTYFEKHWRGGFSLAKSFWGNLIGIDILCYILALAISPFTLNLDFSTIVSLYLIALLIGTIISIWQLVGVWRSARRRPGIWSTIVLFLVIIFALGFIRDRYDHIGIISKLLVFQLEENLAPLPSITVSKNGKELNFVGGIRAGTFDEFKRILDQNPNVKIVHLTSPGGRVRDARQMTELVHQRHLDTFVTGMCASACPIVFMAGDRRYITSTGKIGFHRYFAVSGSDEDIDRVMDTDMADFRSAGVPQSFIDKIYLVSNWSLWEPTLEELKAAHVVTDIGEPPK